MTIEIEISRTSDNGDLSRHEFFEILIKGSEAEFSFDIVGPKDFTSLSYQQIFEFLAAADPEAIDAVSAAVDDGRAVLVNSVQMSPEELSAAFDGYTTYAA